MSDSPLIQFPTPQSQERFGVEEALLREPNLWVPGKKPIGPVKIDWSHPLSDKITDLVVPSTYPPRDLISGDLFSTIKGTPELKPYSVGMAADVQDAIDAFENPSPKVNGTELTLFWHGMWAKNPSAAGGIFLVTHSNNSGTSPYVVISVKNTSNTAGNITGQWNANGAFKNSLADSISVSLNTPTTIVMTINGWEQFLYKNGKQVDVAVIAGTPQYGSGYRLVIGEDFGASRTPGVVCFMGGIAERCWNASEVAAFDADPYQFLIPA